VPFATVIGCHLQLYAFKPPFSRAVQSLHLSGVNIHCTIITLQFLLIKTPAISLNLLEFSFPDEYVAFTNIATV